MNRPNTPRLTAHILDFGKLGSTSQFAPTILETRLRLGTSIHRQLVILLYVNEPIYINMKTRFLFVASFLVTTKVVLSQGTFQDLNFEDAVIARLGTGYSAASAFPGWQ